MAQFSDMIIVNSGLDMIAESQAGGKLIFTKAKLGDGQVGETNIQTLTDIISPKLTVNLSNVTKKEAGHVEVRFTVDNTNLNVGFFAREVGIYAKIGEDGTEKLYGYANAGNYTDYLPDKTTPIDAMTVVIDVVVGNASNIAFTTDKSIVYVTLEDLEEAIDTHNKDSNAHEPAFAAHNVDGNAHKDMVGATSSAAGKRGMVPAPAHGKQNALLAGDGTFHDIATAEQAKAGTDDIHPMTPAKTKAAIEALVEGIAVGDVVYRPFLMEGYVKANGATVNRADYPNLVAYANSHSLWTSNPSSEPWKYGTGNGSTTMVLPDYRNRVIQGGDNTTIKSAGAPNITGQLTYYFYDQGTSGAFAHSAADQGVSPGNSVKIITATFDASRSNPIYGNSTTIQPPALCLIPQIKF